MNPFIKATIKKTIEENTISCTRMPGTDEYTVKNKAGKTLLTIINGWDYGRYIILVNGKSVADIESYANDPAPRTQIQKDVLDIITLVSNEFQKQRTKQHEQDEIAKAKASMSAADLAVFEFLQKQK